MPGDNADFSTAPVDPSMRSRPDGAGPDMEPGSSADGRSAAIAEARRRRASRQTSVGSPAQDEHPAVVPADPHKPEAADYSVIDDLPRPVPIGRAELSVLENHLGTQIDEILRQLKA